MYTNLSVLRGLKIADLTKVAARENRVDLVSYLLDCGVDPNSADEDGE